MRRLAKIAAILILAAAATRGQEDTTLGDGTTVATGDQANTTIDGGNTTPLDDESMFQWGEDEQETSTIEVENVTSTIDDTKSTSTLIDGDGSKMTGTTDEMSSKRPINGTGQNSTVESTDQITEEERQEMVDKHNEYRKKHNADPVELDDEASTISDKAHE